MTEMSPLVSVNIPISRSMAKFQPDRAEGSVGRPLPGISAKVLSPDDGSELSTGEDGLLMVTGPNVMRGYAGQDDMTKKAIVDGWYSTGDIAHIDAEGFLHITGRLSRFSKIGGEMVPHLKVEEEICKILQEGDDDDQIRACVTAVPDEKKGERLIVLYTETTKTVDEIRAALRLPVWRICSSQATMVSSRLVISHYWARANWISKGRRTWRSKKAPRQPTTSLEFRYLCKESAITVRERGNTLLETGLGQTCRDVARENEIRDLPTAASPFPSTRPAFPTIAHSMRRSAADDGER